MSLCVDMHGHIPYDEQMTENPYSPFDQFTVYFYRNLNQEIEFLWNQTNLVASAIKRNWVIAVLGLPPRINIRVPPT